MLASGTSSHEMVTVIYFDHYVLDTPTSERIICAYVC